MSKKRRRMQRDTTTTTTATTPTALQVWLSAGGDIEVPGYTTLAHNPEILAGVNKIALLIGSMTIHLMANQKNGGDVRISNELSNHIDIYPNQYMTRQTWMADIVRTMLIDGDGNAVVWPHTERGLLGDLEKISPYRVTFMNDGTYGYKICIDGIPYDPDNLLHFVSNPDPQKPWHGLGYRIALRDIAENLKQATATENAFMKSKWKPSLIVKVDALTDEFSSPEGRAKLLDSYVSTSEQGEPWMVPAEQFDIQEVRPLSLNDLALSDSVTIDKRTVASILGVPPFVLGVGDYDQKSWNNFIANTIGPLATGIQQELSRKLIINPAWYLRFNVRSLYSYDINTLAQVYDDQYVRGICTGNEVREVLGMAPKDGLDELVMLENYIPAGMIGDQKKLIQQKEKNVNG